MNRPSRIATIAAASTTALVASAPSAMAASIPLLGEVTMGANWGTLGVVAIALGVAGAVAGLRGFVRKIPLVGSWFATGGVTIAVIAALVMMAMNPGGLLAGDGDVRPAASITPATTTSTTWNAAQHEATSDVTFYAANLATKSSISPAVKVFKAGAATEKAANEGSAVAEYSGTMSSGSITFSGLQTQTLGCNVDIHLELASYYEMLVEDVNICVAKNVLGNKDIAVPTFYLEATGTHSLAKTDTSLTCTAGSQCSYSLIVRNTAADTYLHNVAVNFTNVAGASLDSVDAGSPCELVEVSGKKYVKFTDDIGPLGTATCGLKITRASGDTSGSFYLFADDLFQQFGATGWNTNSNVKGASASSQATVSFA